MKKWKKAILALFLSAFAIGAAACNGDGDTPPASPPPAEQPGPADEITVSVSKSHNKAPTPKTATGSNAFGNLTYAKGATVTLIATSNAKYTFVGWEVGGAIVCTDSQYVFTAEEDVAVKAVFSEQKYQVVFMVDDEPISTQEVTEGSKAVLPQNPSKEGYEFDGWESSVEGLTATSNITSNVTFTAKFVPKYFSVEVIGQYAGKGTVSGGTSYAYGTQATLIATATYGYKFDGWYTEAGEKISSEHSYTFTVTQGVRIEARFAVATYNITITPRTGGTATGAGSYAHGSTVTVVATPSNGYTFAGWYENNVKVYSDTTYTFTAETGRSFVAKFEKSKYVLSVTAGTGGTASMWIDDESGAATTLTDVVHNTVVTLKAVPEAGYVFDGWYVGNTQVSNEALCYLNADGAKTYNAKFKRAEFVVAVASEDVNKGTVTGGGTFYHGGSATASATAKPGYTFDGWYDEEGGLVSSEAVYTFDVDKNVVLTAKFTQNTYTITVESADTSKGTVSGGGTTTYNGKITITATPSEGYNFAGWYVGGSLRASTATYEISVTSSATWTAHFASTVYEVKVATEDVNKGTVTGGGNYAHGAQASVTATRKTGYVFDGWYSGGNKVSSDTTYTFTVTGGTSLTAKWKELTYTVTFINSGATYDVKTVQEGMTTGKPVEPTKAGYDFARWSETENGEAAFDFTTAITKDTTIYAVWTAKTYTVTVDTATDDGVGGTATGGGSVAYNSTATLTATTNTGYTFLGWFKDGGTTAVSTTTTYKPTVTANVRYTAKWAINKYTVTVTGTTGGTVTGGGEVKYGGKTTLYASTNDGYTFLGWFKDGGATAVSQSLVYDVTVTANASYTAKWEAIEYTLTLTTETDSGTGGTVSGGGSYQYGSTVEIKATTNTGYTFLGWFKDNSTEVFSQNETLSVGVLADAKYTAKWQIKSYMVEVKTSTDTGTGGTAKADGMKFNHGATVTLTATTNTGYTFLGWFKDDSTEAVSTSTTYKPTVTAKVTYTAKWKINQYTVTVNSADTSMGTVSGGGKYNYDTSVTITATEKTGYAFDGWYNGDSKVASTAFYTFTVTKSITLTAKWVRGTCKVTVNSENTNYGTVSGGDTYNANTSVTVKATAKTGYNFAGWYNGSTKVSSNASYTFTVTADITLTAKWTAKTYSVKATANIEAAGSISGVNSYSYNTEATLKATANKGYVFLGWYSAATLKSTDATYKFTVKGETTLTAKFSANIGIDGDYWARNNTATTTMTSSKITFSNTQDGDSVYTKDQYTNFTLQYDVTGLRNGTYGWLGFIYGSEVANPFYANTNNNFVYLTKEGWHSVTWYKADGTLDAVGLSDKILTENTVNVKWTVSGGKLSVTLTFADGTTATKTDIPSFTGNTKGYVAIPAVLGSSYTITNLSLVDLDGRDFNAAATTVTSSMQSLAEASQVRLLGRTHFDSDKSALVLRNSASGFELYTMSESVTASISVSGLFSGETMRIKVWVDGGTPTIISLTSTSATTITLASGLSSDMLHHIKVAKVNEALGVGAEHKDNCNIYVHSLSYDSTDAPTKVAADDGSLKIEVYGDSITCGYGALGNVATNPSNFDTAEEDATVTYAYQTAEAIGAKINIVAHQGWAIGQSSWGTEEKPLTIPLIYDKVTDAHDIAWDFTSYTPDIVIINLGTNDPINNGVTKIGENNYVLFCWQYLNFLQQLYAKYPNAKFVLCYGMMDAVGGPLEHAVSTWLPQACSTPPAEGYAVIPNLITVDLTGASGPYMSGGGSHPSQAEHTAASETLRAALKNAGWVD